MYYLLLKCRETKLTSIRVKHMTRPRGEVAGAGVVSYIIYIMNGSNIFHLTLRSFLTRNILINIPMALSTHKISKLLSVQLFLSIILRKSLKVTECFDFLTIDS